MQITAPTAAQSYVEVNDMKHYKVVYVPCRYELVNSKGVNCFVLDIYKSENIEVIGNIHDNPELLGGENNGNN